MILCAVVFFKCFQQHEEKWNAGNTYEMEIGNVYCRNHNFSSFRRSNGAKSSHSKEDQQPLGLIKGAQPVDRRK